MTENVGSTTNTNNTIIDKTYINKYDIMKRYNVGESVALRFIREIKSVNGGGRLSKGKVLPCELSRWETYAV